MNYLFIINQQLRNQLLKILAITAFIIASISPEKQAQVMEPDSVIVNQTWTDNNGVNELYIYVYAACNLQKPPYDGYKSKIQVKLKNEKYKLKIEYDEKNYQMCMILFKEDDIFYVNKNNTQIAFIPFFYCANADSEIKVSYFILYNNLKFLKHIYFYCDEDGNCRLNDNLNKKLKGMPEYLKKEFIDQLSKYKTIDDFHQS